MQDVGSNFIDFERQDNMAYIAKIVKNCWFFIIFGTSASVGCSVVGIIGCLIFLKFSLILGSKINEKSIKNQRKK